MKNLDCPLCGKKQAITHKNSGWELIVNPDPKYVGGYSLKEIRVKYNYSHASECPVLKKVFLKKSLLIYHVKKACLPIDYSDLFSFDNYQRGFKALGFKIKSETFRKGLTWRTKMFITIPIVGDEHDTTTERFLTTEAKSPEIAFSLLRFRLVCGEVFESKLLSTKGPTSWQFEIKNKKISISQV